MKHRGPLGVAGLVCIALTLTACGSAQASLETQCRQEVADHFDLDLDEVDVTWSEETPSGSLDWRGTYASGVGEYGAPNTFACGAGLNPSELTQVVVINTDGSADAIR